MTAGATGNAAQEDGTLGIVTYWNTSLRAQRLRRGSSLFATALLFAALPALAAPINGTVTNRTTGKLSAGDTVALISFDTSGQGGMQVAAETKSDAQGRYQIENASPGMHLIRVSHQKAAYFEPAPPGTSVVDVGVYDVAPVVEGVSTEADVLSMQTGPDGALHVMEDFFVRNSSQPARTQLSDHAYEFFLPEGARLNGSAAKGPNGVPVESSPVPLAGKGHYAFVFPLRPGQTRFQVSYTLPYDGKTMGWTQREALSTENLVVLLPKTMTFKPEGTDWQPVPANPDAQTFVRKGVAPQVPVAFSINGQGELPRDTGAAPDGGGGNTPGTGGVATQQSMENDTRPGGGLGPPVDTPDPLAKYKPWLLGTLGVLLLGGAAWLMRGAPAQAEARAEEAQDEYVERADGPRGLRLSLERALLALERANAVGEISEEEYDESRTGLRKALHRVLAREAAATTPAAAGAPADPVVVGDTSGNESGKVSGDISGDESRQA